MAFPRFTIVVGVLLAACGGGAGDVYDGSFGPDGASGPDATLADASTSTDDASANEAPSWPARSLLSATSLNAVSVHLVWTPAIDDVMVVAYRLFVDGTEVGVVDGAMLSSDVVDLSPGIEYEFRVEAGDAAGAWSTGGPTARATPIPIDPSLIASALDPWAPTRFYDATAFLYDASDPVQPGVAPGAITPETAAVIRGQALDRAGDPLVGVAISILDHDEYGSTATRADGVFDLAVNGGGPLTVVYRKAGHLEVHRQVAVPWEDYVWADDAVLVPLDPEVTQIDANASTMQVARSSLVSDMDGDRQVTMMFSPGTSASMTFADTPDVPLTTLSVRATEYTVGDRGLEAMPATLPPNSAYTYAVELSVDEALQAGASSVVFDRPVVTYIDNFLDVPVGVVVPIGYYDRERGAWVADDNGLVVAIVGLSGVLAELDLDGDGFAEDASALGVAGITDAERETLSGLYSIGDTLWRAAIDHFTPWDCNFPYGPPSDATRPYKNPAPQGPGQPTTNDTPTDDKCESAASVIFCETQALGESIPISGTPYTLYYSSDRVRGRRDNVVELDLSGDEIPASLVSMRAVGQVAGQRFELYMPAATNQSALINWNGEDAYGRRLQGSQSFSSSLSYYYPSQYYGALGSDAFESSFARFEREGSVGGTRFTLPRRRTQGGYTITQDFERDVMAAPGRIYSEGAGLGGWTIDVHHSYDPVRNVLELGNGQRRSATALARAPIVQTFAGIGSTGTYVPIDGLRADEAYFGRVRDVVVAPSGEVYVVGGAYFVSQVWRIDTSGVIHLFAGTGELEEPQDKGDPWDYNDGDGGLAVDAVMSPSRVDIGPDGSVYIISAELVRRVDRDGIIERVAGTEDGTDNGDGGPAIEAQVTPYDLAVSPTGDIFISEPSSSRIRRIGADGVITTAVGTGVSGYSGDGGPALEANVDGPSFLDVAPDGTLYFNSFVRVRAVDPSGTITTVAGNGDLSNYGDGQQATDVGVYNVQSLAVGLRGDLYLGLYSQVRHVTADGIITTIAGDNLVGYSGDGSVGPQARLFYLRGMDVAPDGAVFIAEGANNVVRTLTAPGPRAVAGTKLIPSADGDEVYVFTAQGRHTQTLDAITNTVIRQFGYDTNGYLASISDRAGNVTTITRDLQGNPTGIVGPGGATTSLTVDSFGYLSGVGNALGETVALTHGSEGLLIGLADPTGGARTYDYDLSGRLISDTGPDGSSKTLSRADRDNGFTVSVATSLGRTATYATDWSPTGAVTRRHTTASGEATEVRTLPDGTREVEYDDGTLVSATLVSDPRWGMLAPYPAEVVVSIPSRPDVVATLDRAVTLADVDDPLSLITYTETTSHAAGVETVSYDGATSTYTTTSAAGRSTAYVVDFAGRVTSISIAGMAPLVFAYDANGALTTLSRAGQWLAAEHDADGHVIAVEDALGRRVEYEHDSDGRVVGLTTPSAAQYSFGYDEDGNRTSIVDPAGAVHSMTYTSLDQLSSYTAPGAAVSMLTSYDIDRKLDGITLPGGRFVDYRYDAGGRYLGPDYTEATIDFAYADATGQVSAVTRSPAAIGSAHTTAFSYTGWLLDSEVVSGAADGAFDYHYDDRGRIDEIQFDSGADTIVRELWRDGDGYIGIDGPFAILRDGPAGAVTSMTDGIGATSYVHDLHARPASISHDVAGSPIYTVSVSYDDSGRITQRVESVGAGPALTEDYAYTLDGRLGTVWRNGVIDEVYGYDASGNRTSRRLGAGPVEMAFYDLQNRIEDLDGIVYVVDDDGHTVQRGGDTFTYSARGELLWAELASAEVVTYSYDGIGRRVARSSSLGGSEQYFYGNPDDPTELSYVRDAAGDLVALTYDNTRRLTSFTRGGQRYYVACDLAGSPRVVADSAGAIVKQVDYDSFGRVVVDSAPAFAVPIGFGGGVVDPATGWVRMIWRDYDPDAGRFTTRDPLGFGGGYANLYTYVDSDPINGADPSGLEPAQITSVGGCAGACIGIRIGISSEGVSVCVEVGAGVSTPSLETLHKDGLDKTGDHVVAEVSAEAGPFKIGKKWTIECVNDERPTVKSEPIVEAYPFKVQGDDAGVKIDIKDAGKKIVDGLAGKATRTPKVKAKVTYRTCQQFK